MSKFKTVICDDEVIIRENLAQFIDSAFDEIEVCGIYYDGEQVLNHLKRDNIDILITDIRMHKKNGIDIAEYIYRHSIHTQVIFITAYSDFEYAKAAIDYKVTNFLVKPVNLDDLSEAVNSAIERVKAQVESALSSGESYLKERKIFGDTLKNYIYGEISFAEFKELGFSAHENKFNCKCSTINISLNTQSSNEDINWQDIAECEEENISVFLIAQTEHTAVAVAFIYSDYSHFEKHIDYIKKTLKLFHSLSCAISVTDYENIEFIQTQAKDNLFKLYYDLLKSHRKNLSDEFFKNILPNFNTKQIKRLIDEVCIFARDEYSLDFSAKSKESATTLEKSKLIGIIRDIHTQLSGNVIFEDIHFKNIIDYINKNYSDSYLSLESVASAFALSISSLNRYFKKNLGQNFINYLTEIRIFEAKKLLTKSVKIKEVANAVGFNDSKYFSKVFLKYVGMTPKEYAISHSGAKDENI